MSETNHSPNHHSHPEHPKAHEAVNAPRPEAAQATPELSTESHEPLEALREQVYLEALESDTINIEQDLEQGFTDNGLLFNSLRKEAYEEALQSVQSQLTKPERVLSKITHNRTVDRVSEFAARTIARPKSLLLGASLAAVGSGWLLLIAKRQNYPYNLTVFAVLLTAGYLLGLILELTVKLFKKLK